MSKTNTGAGWHGTTFGALAAISMLVAYVAILTAVSGWEFAVAQFLEFWHFVFPLALGFGVQVALFLRLRALVGRTKDAGAVVATSGTTSTAAMISCCAHYLANVAPILGATGLVAFAAQFQVELFWIGLLFNAGGIAFVGTKLFHASKEHASCPG